MRRPDGFEPIEPEPRAPAAEEAGERTVDLAELVRARRDALRREALEREAAESVPQRRWALSAYGDLDEGEAADAVGTVPGTAPVEPLESGSHAQRVDKAWREAEREQRRAERAEAREAARAARAAKRARVRRERAEVRRFTAARRRQLRTALVTAGALAVALAVLVGLVWSPLMSVREVRVEGTERLGAAVVQQALADSMGQPIATVTEEGVAERLQSIPQIESFRVDIVPPSTVIVRIVEREPAAIVPAEGGEAVIDAAGVVLGGVDESTSALPRLEGVEVGTEEFEAVASVLVSVPRSVLEATATIAAATPSDIQLSLHSGQTVLWGGADESQLKADVLAALLETQDPALAVVLDVSAPETPVVSGS